jgi:hypoxia up-regulated 1
MWNWSARLFLTEAHDNLTAENEAGLPSKWTLEELNALEKTLIEHEKWLNEHVEKQKSVKANEDPAIETTEMKARAKVLETQLQKLMKRKIPKIKKTTATSSTTSQSASTSTAAEAESTESDAPHISDDDLEELLRQLQPEIEDLEEGAQIPIPTHTRDEL